MKALPGSPSGALHRAGDFQPCRRECLPTFRDFSLGDWAEPCHGVKPSHCFQTSFLPVFSPPHVYIWSKVPGENSSRTCRAHLRPSSLASADKDMGNDSNARKEVEKIKQKRKKKKRSSFKIRTKTNEKQTNMTRKTCDISTRDFPISDANPHSEDKKENRLNTTLY